MPELKTATDTASLIDSLTGSLTPVRRRAPVREILMLAGIGAVQVLGVAALFGATTAAVFEANPLGLLAKAVLLGGLSLAFLALAFRSFEPQAPRQSSLTLAIGAFVAGFGALVLDKSFAGGVTDVLTPSNGVVCLLSSVSFALPVFLAMAMCMRGAAPTQLGASSLFVGVGAGAWGVFLYGLHCPFLNIAFVAVWYGGAVALVTLAARIILPRVAGW